MRVTELLNSIEDDADMVMTEPRSGSEEPREPSPTPSMSPASTPSSSSASSSASFTPEMSPAGSSRAAGSDVGDSDMIDIKMEVAEDEPGIAPSALIPAPPPFRPLHHRHSPFCQHYSVSAWQMPPPALGWAPWMAPPAGLYSLYRLDNNPQGPMFMSDADMAYALTLPPPKGTYVEAECKGLAGGPSLMAFHCHMLQFRLPKLKLHGKSIRDLGFEYLDAGRSWKPLPGEDTLGIDSERLAWRAVAAIMSFREEDHAVNFLHEVHDSLRGPRPDLSARSLGAGLHGTLSMIRLMLQWCQEPEAIEVADILAVEVLWRLTFDYLGHLSDGILCGKDGGMRGIFTSYNNIEDDLGIVVEIAGLWPEGARQPRGISINNLPNGITRDTKIAIIVSETIDMLEERIDCDRWPKEVAEHCARYDLAKGPWYVYSCLWHLDRWLCGSRASPGLRDRISDALWLVNQSSRVRMFPLESAPEDAPVTKCGLCGCRPNQTAANGGPSN